MQTHCFKKVETLLDQANQGQKTIELAIEASGPYCTAKKRKMGCQMMWADGMRVVAFFC
jgi:hypothetical protein